MEQAKIKIDVQNVYKVYGQGKRAQKALKLAKQNEDKATIMKKTGVTLGLRGISLQIKHMETFVIMGLSGSGKSTLIRHFNRLIDPSDGRIVVDGEDVLKLSKQQLMDFRKHRISMVFQKFGLLPHQTVISNVAYGLLLAGVNRDEALAKAQAQIELVGLAGTEEQYPAQLSGGMQQRVGLARALATDADILLMDEPFSALDPLIRHDMQNQLISLRKKLKKTIVFITHDLEEAIRLGDRVALLQDGEIRQCGSPQEIIKNPADDYVASFVKHIKQRVVFTKEAG